MASLESVKDEHAEESAEEFAEEFADVLEDLMDADHESDPNLNLDESEFADIIDEEEVKSAKLVQTIGTILILFFYILLFKS